MKVKATINRNGLEAKVIHVSRMNYQIYINDVCVDGRGSLEFAIQRANELLDNK